MDKVRCIFFRHGETDWNKEDRFQGHTDIGLNENGFLQAKTLNNHFSKWEVESILCSDLLRTRQTLEGAKGSIQLPITISQQLREIHLGDAEGMLRSEIIKKYGDEAHSFWTSTQAKDLDFGYPGGETKREHLDRMNHFISMQIKENPTWKKIAISTHGGSVRRMISASIGGELHKNPITHCSFHFLDFDRETSQWTFDSSYDYKGSQFVLS